MSTRRKKTGQTTPKIVCVFRDGDGEGFTLEIIRKSGVGTKQVRRKKPVVLCSEADWPNLVTFIKECADPEG